MLRDPDFLRLWVGTTASGLATWALPVVLGLAAVHGELSSGSLGLLLAARTLGFVTAVLLGGLLADRFGTVNVIHGAGWVATVASIVMGLTLGRQTPMAVLAGVAVGIGQGGCRPAFQAHVARVVETARRHEANAYITLAVRLTTLLGPFCAAVLTRVMTARAVVLSIGLLWLITAVVPSRPCRVNGSDLAARLDTAERGSPLRDLLDGFVEASRHRWFMAGLMALIPIVSLGYSATNIVLPAVSREEYGSDVVFVAATTAYTLGALGGAVVMARWRPRNEGWVAFCGIGLYSLAPLVLLAESHAVVLVGAYAVIGAGMELFNVPWFTATQREVAADKLARVSSVDFLVSYGFAPLGLAVYPWAVASSGRHCVLMITLGFCAVTPVLAALVPGARRLRDPACRAS